MADNNKKKTPKKFAFNIYWMYMLVFAGLLAAFWMNDNAVAKEVSQSQFETMVASGGVQSIVVYNKEEAEAVINDSLANVVFGNKENPRLGRRSALSTPLRKKLTSGKRQASSRENCLMILLAICRPSFGTSAPCCCSLASGSSS